MGDFVRFDRIDFDTNLSYDDVLAVTEQYIMEYRGGKEHYIDKGHILYKFNREARVVDEPVWYVDIISVEMRKKFPDGYDTLAISDREGRVVYVQNDHGVVVELY